MQTNYPRIGTVVLNYRTFQDTLACVESLKKQDYPDHKIIVVENGSENASAEMLKKEYAEDETVTVICSEENLGFARGNNLGIRYAVETLKCEFVFVLNSDTIVPTGVFHRIIEAYKADIGAISPSVCDPSGKKTTPSENSDDIIQQIEKRRKGLLLARFLCLPVINSLYSFYTKRKKEESLQDVAAPVGKYVLQGCSYFLTPAFFAHYKQLFPGTFLYWEEIDLLYYLYRAGLYSVAVDTPPVVHYGGGSTKDLRGDIKKERRKLKLSYESYQKSKDMLKMSYQEIREAYN